jgi:hypothetical protein
MHGWSFAFQAMVSAIQPCGTSCFCVGEDDAISIYHFVEETKDISKIVSVEFPFPACCTCLSHCLVKDVIYVGTAAGSILWYQFDAEKKTLDLIGHVCEQNGHQISLLSNQ